MVVHGQGFALGASGPSLVRMRYSLPFYLYSKVKASVMQETSLNFGDYSLVV